MIIWLGSLIWHVVLDLIGVIVAIILLYIIGVAVYTLFQQYIRHCEMKKLDIELSVYNKIAKSDKKDGDDNGEKKDQ